MNFKIIVNFFYDSIKLFYKIFKLRDPCKKCIVKICCTEKCNEYILINNVTEGSTVTELKFLAIITIGLIIFFIYILLSGGLILSKIFF